MMCNAVFKIGVISIIFTILVSFIVYAMLMMHERRISQPLAEIKVQIDKHDKQEKYLIDGIKRGC